MTARSNHFICNHCDENVNTARNLTRHISNKHEKLFDIPVIIGECLFQKSYTLNNTSNQAYNSHECLSSSCNIVYHITR